MTYRKCRANCPTSESANGAVNAEVRVQNGSIDFSGPKNLSASLMAETDLGTIESD